MKRHVVRAAVVTAFIVAWHGLAIAASTAVVKGTVVLPTESGAPNETVVSLEGQIGAVTPNTVVIDQHDQTFVPRVAVVVQGGTVEFRNSDAVLHNVYAASSAKRFDLGMFGGGEQRRVQFDKPGVVELRCNVHPKMHGFVVVVENNYFATADAQGNFQITGVPVGRYKIRAWHEGLPITETWANLDDASIRNVELRLQK